MSDATPDTMLTVTVHAAHDLRLDDAPVPVPGPDEVLVRITHGGICGSDLHYVADGRNGAFVVREPLTLGHEVVGRVHLDGRRHASPGEALAEGTPVTLRPATYDTTSGRFDPTRPSISPGSRYLGSAASDPHTQGAFSEFFIAAADHVVPLPDELPLDRGVLAEPLAVALHAIRRAGDPAGRSVLVSGAGPIGLLAVRALVRLGATEVWVTDVLDRPLDVATRLGATRVVDLRSETLPRDAFDVVIEASGAPIATSSTLTAVRSGGVVVQVGMLPADPRPFVLAELVSREIDLRGAFRFNDELDDAVALLAADPGFDAVVTHRFEAREAVEAFAVAADSAVSSKVVLRFGD